MSLVICLTCHTMNSFDNCEICFVLMEFLLSARALLARAHGAELGNFRGVFSLGVCRSAVAFRRIYHKLWVVFVSIFGGYCGTNLSDFLLLLWVEFIGFFVVVVGRIYRAFCYYCGCFRRQFRSVLWVFLSSISFSISTYFNIL